MDSSGEWFGRCVGIWMTFVTLSPYYAGVGRRAVDARSPAADTSTGVFGETSSRDATLATRRSRRDARDATLATRRSRRRDVESTFGKRARTSRSPQVDKLALAKMYLGPNALLTCLFAQAGDRAEILSVGPDFATYFKRTTPAFRRCEK